ncbi:MAG: HAMP domain-containing protein [Chloroflexi bacterium]|nr:HAMP domain-containing protein [Chloroflexota bacterium]
MFAHLQWRIAASYVALIAAVLLALGVYLASELPRQQLAMLETQLHRQARLVADDAQRHLATQDPAGLDALAKQLGREIGARVTLIAADGTVLGDSDHDPASMDNHATRPEVQQALQTGSGLSERHSATVEQDLLYVAVPMAREGELLGVARVALPVHEVQQASRGILAAVATTFAAAALLAIALALLLARITVGRIETLTQAARRLAGGDLHQTVPVQGHDELSLLGQAFNDMAARLRAHVQAISEERARLAAVLRYMADGVVIVDAEGMVHLVNPAAARLLQVTPAQAEGRSVVAVVRDHELAAAVSAAQAGEEAAERPRLVELGPPGQRRTVQALASRIPRAHEARPRILLILQDVTELRRAETVRRDFVANVSHELRTPVAALKALVETLEGGALEAPEVARDFLTRMGVEVDGLAQLVAELLELSRIESGQGALRLQPVDLAAEVATAAERLRPLAERQGVHLTVEAHDGLPSLSVDPERLQQVVTNLVHNAVKFTPPGGRVTVCTEWRDREVAVVVADTGCGIAPEALPRLFERFYKADRARAGGGTGLGLAIAKHVVQAHGGRVWAESAGEGQGATFTFTVPLTEPSTNL